MIKHFCDFCGTQESYMKHFELSTEKNEICFECHKAIRVVVNRLKEQSTEKEQPNK